MGQYFRAYLLRPKKGDAPREELVIDFNGHSKLTEHCFFRNARISEIIKMIKERPAVVAWIGDYSEEELKADGKERVYKRVWDPDAKLFYQYTNCSALYSGYLLNWSKQQYVDLGRYMLEDFPLDRADWAYHPLPLLTAVGNGQGGGDYFAKEGSELIGSWAFDIISYQETRPENIEQLFCHFASVLKW